jgi:hypothetical protein
MHVKDSMRLINFTIMWVIWGSNSFGRIFGTIVLMIKTAQSFEEAFGESDFVLVEYNSK